MLRSRVGEPLAERGGRARRYYTVTPSGLESLRAARTALDRLSSGLEPELGLR
jgi:DNA-binding PadR family transcriptional regulator